MNSNASYFGSLAISILIGYLVYKNARERNLDAAAAWGILSFFFGLIGAAVYYFVILRPNKKGTPEA